MSKKDPMMNEARIDNLDQAIESFQSGASVEETLAAVTAGDTEIEPLLRAGAELSAALAPPMPLEARRRAKQTAMDAWDLRASARKRWNFAAWFPRLAMPAPAIAAALALIFVFGGGTGTILASADSVPGDALYGVKQAKENVSLWLARTQEDRILSYMALVDRRVDEIMILTEANRSTDLTEAVDRLGSHVSALGEIASDGVDDDAGLLALEEASASTFAARAALSEAIDSSSDEINAELQRSLTILDSARVRVTDAIDQLRRGQD
jgi:hypothetical protein